MRAHQSLEARANLSGREVAGRRDEFHPERHRALAAIGELGAETETLIKAAKRQPSLEENRDHRRRPPQEHFWLQKAVISVIMSVVTRCC